MKEIKIYLLNIANKKTLTTDISLSFKFLIYLVIIIMNNKDA